MKISSSTLPIALMLLIAVLASGCAIAPTGPGEPVSVTQDISLYLKREWPLKGPPVIPADALPASACACGQHGSCDSGSCPVVTESGEDYSYAPESYTSNGTIWADDWDAPEEMQKPMVIKVSRPPAIPNAPSSPGRFHPVPVRPVFAPNAM